MLPGNAILSVLDCLEGEVGLYLEDVTVGDKLAVNPNQIFPSASIIKIPILAALFKAAAEGKVDLNAKTTLKAENRVGGGGVLTELSIKLRPTVLDLATLMIIVSDNAATNELIDLVGMDQVNDLVRKLGLKQTVLQRKMMDRTAAKAGRDNFTSAQDMGLLLQLLAKGQVVNEEASTKIIDIMKKQQLRNKLPSQLPREVIVAHKTGDLDFLEHDVGIFFLPERTYILAILTDKLSSNAAGAQAIADVSRIVYETLREE